MWRRRETKADAFLRVGYAELRTAVDRADDDQLIRIIDHIRAEAGEEITLTVVGNLLRLARNPITDPAGAAAIETALARYQARYRRF